MLGPVILQLMKTVVSSILRVSHLQAKYELITQARKHPLSLDRWQNLPLVCTLQKYCLTRGTFAFNFGSAYNLWGGGLRRPFRTPWGQIKG